MAIQMRRGNLADFDPTKMMPGEFAVTLDTDNNLNKRVFITFAAGTVKQLMTVEDATAQMIEATDAATAEAEAWAHGNSFTATEMFTSAGSATVTLAYSPSSINVVKINDVVTTAYTHNDKVITFNTAPAVGSIITVIYGVSTSTDNAKYYKGQAANSASTASTKATQASTSATNAANSATTASTKATQAGNSATLAESYAVGGTGTRPGEDTDNAKYYKDQMATYLSGIYHFIGSVNSYADLPTMGMVNGDTYDILTADPTHEIAAGDNVAWTGTGWDKLSGTIATMIGATASSNGAKGLVPAPMIADKDNFLRGDGTWANPNTAVDDVYSVMGQMGAKNLIPYPYYEKTHVESGITWTDNGDGTVTANGTATASHSFELNIPSQVGTLIKLDKNKTYVYTDTTHAGIANTAVAGIRYYAEGVTPTTTNGTNASCRSDNNWTVTVTNAVYAYVYIYAYNGKTINNLTFKPMLRLASDTDNTYQPYAKTNKQLTEDKAELVSVRDYVNELGVKNLIPYPYDYSSRPILSGITYTINEDGSITMNGTSTGRANYWLYDHGQAFMNLKSGDYILSKSGRNDVAHVVAFYKGSTWVKQVTAKEQDMPVSIDVNSNEYDNIGIAVSISDAGVTVENVTVYPMLRLAADINDDTYVPFAKSNRQLTGVIGDLSQTGVTGASVAAQIGALDALIGDITQTSVTGATVAAQLGVLGNILSFTHFVKIPFTTSVLDSIKAAFENNTIPVDIYGITFGIVAGAAGSQRVVVVAQNQKLSTTQTRYAAIYFGAYTAPRFLQRQDNTDWTDVAL